MKWLILVLCLITSACTMGPPIKHVINGKTVVHTDKKFLGLPVATKVEEVKTKQQHLDDLAVEKATREQDLDLKTEERQSAAAFWIGVALLACAVVFVFVGYIAAGWRFWGTMAAISGALGAAFWSFEHLIPMLKWPAYCIPVAIVLWTMYKLKDFSLLDKLKKSEPGKIL